MRGQKLAFISFFLLPPHIFEQILKLGVSVLQNTKTTFKKLTSTNCFVSHHFQVTWSLSRHLPPPRPLHSLPSRRPPRPPPAWDSRFSSSTSTCSAWSEKVYTSVSGKTILSLSHFVASPRITPLKHVKPQ